LELNYNDIRGREAFLPLLNVEGNPVAFAQGFESLGIDRRMMNEHIRTVFLLDESEPFLVVKPFYSSIGHDDILLS
jgi:hypothetical protein